jgi:hypothetical protein
MTIHVDELRTDVSVEPATATAPTGDTDAPEQFRWRRVEGFRALRDRLAREAERTSSDGYGD